jgi:mercuric ion transport protein
MKELLEQCSSVAGAGFAGACCLGATAALTVLSAIGAGFLINDAFLIPLYVGLLGLSLWLLYSSARSHDNLTPFWSGLGAALVALAGLWIHAALVYAGLAVLIASSVWDFRNGRRAPACSS